jgi:organic hydroperoxide reductase OsmC/OhrA
MNISISAKILWENRKGSSFLKGKYSREHIWELTNNIQIKASSSPQIVPMPYSNPAFIDPEEAFVCSVASCHMLFFLSIASKKRIDILKYTDHPIGFLAKKKSGETAITEIILQPKVMFANDLGNEQLEKLHQLAHQNCFIANSVTSKIQIK